MNTEHSSEHSDQIAEQHQSELDYCRQWIIKMTEVLEAASSGDMERRVINCDKNEDLQRLGQGINRFIDVADAYVRESGASLGYAVQGRYFRRVLLRGLHGSFKHGAELINQATVDMELQAKLLDAAKSKQLALADEFENNVLGFSMNVANSAKALQGTASELAESAIQTTEQASTVSAIAEQATTKLESVVQTAKGLESSLTSMERSVVHSGKVSDDAVGKASTANELIAKLSDDSNRIGAVVNMISGVASQTNLLALNATIEAARAGEAGKGFAVVASEVKNLANQTGEATQRISGDINAVQAATSHAVEAISEIGKTVDTMKQVAEQIAESINEQKQINRSIAEDMTQTEAGCRKVTHNALSMASVAEQTNISAGQVLDSANGLSEIATFLQKEVVNFLEEIRRDNA